EAIDGFRCDVAGNVPLDFWQQAIPQLRKQKNIFMLAEAWEPALLKDNLFDMAYGWEGHHTLNKIAQGKETVKNFDAYIEKINKDYEANDILMNFVDNHDENSWNGTIKSRLGEAEPAMTALTYLMPGMPLIYSGNEYGLEHSLKFFEKDSIPKIKGKQWDLRAKLGKIKNKIDALHGGKSKAAYKKISASNENVLAFERTKNGKRVIYLANLSAKPVSVSVPITGQYKDLMNEKMMDLNTKQVLSLLPWQYYILTK
ncbi:alpha-glucosidase C-terminal domain-containing protein, partial [Flavobacterium sp.]|uniref:alpha-glucosidase C-terminal domain-containing protein n=1 Tax=Flavobacterium sp. TaxID=239 RepID=UPI0037BE3EB7